MKTIGKPRSSAGRALEDAEGPFRALAGRIEAAREEERTRIAREVHDELGQLLAAIQMEVGLIALHLEGATIPPIVLERLAAVSQLVDTTSVTVRRIGTELRPGILDLGLAEAIEWQAREFERRSGIRVDVQLSAALSGLAQGHATALFRVFQEILTNVARHARATRVVARLTRDARSLTLEVRDDGRGILAEEVNNSTSLGLLGMRERAFLLGGTFHIQRAEPRGTLVRVRLPLVEEPG